LVQCTICLGAAAHLYPAGALQDLADRPTAQRAAGWHGRPGGRDERDQRTDQGQRDDNHDPRPATSNHLVTTHTSAPSLHVPDLMVWRGRYAPNRSSSSVGIRISIRIRFAPVRWLLYLSREERISLLMAPKDRPVAVIAPSVRSIKLYGDGRIEYRGKWGSV